MSTPEYFQFRCCMCPNASRAPQSDRCPAHPFFHPKESPCRFVKTYADENGYHYYVHEDLSNGVFKVYYHKPGEKAHFDFLAIRRKTFDRAQADLNKYAEKKAWKEC